MACLFVALSVIGYYNHIEITIDNAGGVEQRPYIGWSFKKILKQVQDDDIREKSIIKIGYR